MGTLTPTSLLINRQKNELPLPLHCTHNAWCIHIFYFFLLPFLWNHQLEIQVFSKMLCSGLITIWDWNTLSSVVSQWYLLTFKDIFLGLGFICCLGLLACWRPSLFSYSLGMRKLRIRKLMHQVKSYKDRLASHLLKITHTINVRWNLIKDNHFYNWRNLTVAYKSPVEGYTQNPCITETKSFCILVKIFKTAILIFLQVPPS